MQNGHIWTALVLIRIQPETTQIGGDARGAVRERRLRNVIAEGLGVVLDRRRGVTAGTRGALPW